MWPSRCRDFVQALSNFELSEARGSHPVTPQESVGDSARRLNQHIHTLAYRTLLWYRMSRRTLWDGCLDEHRELRGAMKDRNLRLDERFGS